MNTTGKSKLLLVSLLLLAYYIGISTILMDNHVHHSEALFLSEKLKMLFLQQEGRLRTVVLTFPTIVFYSTIPFAFISYAWAPVIASSFCTTLLFYRIMRECGKKNIPLSTMMALLLPLFILHPGIVYVAVSGRSAAAVLLFFYLFFLSLFNYFNTHTSYYLAKASIYLFCLIFCNFNFLLLLASFIPFIILISLEGLKSAKIQDPVIEYYQAINDPLLRRKLIYRTFATYIILFSLPVGSILLFRALNIIHADDANYFLTSPYANWFVSKTPLTPSVAENPGEHMVLLQLYIVLCTPLLLAVFLLFKGSLYELLFLIAPFLLITLLILQNHSSKTIEYHLAFLLLAIVAVVYYWGNGIYRRKEKWILLVASWLSIIGGLLYFAGTRDTEETRYTAFARDFFSEHGTDNLMNIDKDREIVHYLSTLLQNKKVLIDDAAAYSLVAQLPITNNIILPVQRVFLTTVEDPAGKVNYICIATAANKLSHYTMLNNYYIEQLGSKKNYTITLRASSNNWQVYELN